MTIKSTKLIGDGSYGCVYNPALPCEGNKGTKKKNKKKIWTQYNVGKVFTDQHEAVEEFKLMKTIKKIDKKGKYTIPIEEKCDVELRDHEVYDQLKKCELFRDEFAKKNFESTYVQLVSKHGGISLKDFVHTRRHVYDLFEVCSKLMNVVSGLIFLHRKSICHRDIKEANIVISTTRPKRSFIIDFGLMKRMDEVYTFDELRVLEFEYVYYPPEFRVISNYMKLIDDHYDRTMMSVKRFKKLLLEECFANYENIIDLYDEVLGLTQDNLLEQLSNFVDHLMDASNLKTLNYVTDPTDHDIAIRKIMHRQVEKVDVFSFGIILLKLLYRSRSYRDEPHSKSMKDMKELIRKCIHFDVRKRHTMKNVKKDLQYVLKNA